MIPEFPYHLHVKLPLDLKDQLESIANQNNRTMSEVCRLIIRRGLILSDEEQIRESFREDVE